MEYSYKALDFQAPVKRKSVFKNHVLTDYYDDGVTILRTTEYNIYNQCCGVCKTYRKDGTLEIESHYKNDILDGEYTEYYEDGVTPKSRCFYKAGKKDGMYTEYCADGITKTYECEYRGGKKNGRCNEYYSSGIISKICYYRDDKLNEWCETFYESLHKDGDGLPPTQSLCYYNKGKIDGKYEKFSIFRKIPDIVCHYNMGVLVNDYIEYYPGTSLLKKKCSYNDKGELNGEFKTFYPDGTPEIICEYVNGVQKGKFKKYYPNGVLKIEYVNEGCYTRDIHRYDEFGHEIKGDYMTIENQIIHPQMKKRIRRKAPRTAYQNKINGK